MTALGDQASRLRELMERAAAAGTERAAAAAVRERPDTSATHREARVMAIASGKGGVGKTNLAVNIALTLAARGRRITIVDGDLGLGNADVISGANATGHLGEVLDARRSAEDIATPLAPHCVLVPGGSALSRLPELDAAQKLRLCSALERIEARSDLVILDCGAGVGDLVLELIRCADLALVVVTPEPTALADGYALIKRLSLAAQHTHTARLGVTVNQSRDDSEAREVFTRLSSVSARFLGRKLEFMGGVTHDQAVSRAVRLRTPFAVRFPASRASRDVAALSENVWKWRTPPTHSQPGNAPAGFFGKLRRRFGV